MKGLTDVPGILVGHATNVEAITGCTAILCPPGTVGGLDVRGSATASSELGTLDPGHVAPFVHAIVLSGGSAFGLEAACGVRLYLEGKGIGFTTGAGVVPIVPSASIFDLPIAKRGVRPGREMGARAAQLATDAAVEEGNVGAGAGATVGKIFGMKQAMKGGVGTASVTLGSGVMVSAMVVVNALGDVIDPATGKVVAGARKTSEGMDFVGSAAAMRHGIGVGFTPANTTLAVIATTARFDKVQTSKVAALASLGVARTISPVNTMSDGDITFALSAGKEQASVDSVGVAAAEALAEAVLRAVRAAKTVAGIPGLRT